jgi:hypothetical protein
MMRNPWRFRIAALLMAGAVFIGGAQAQAPTTPTPTPGAPDGPAINPLTGLPFTAPAAPDRPPVLVKISNSPPVVRPQHGLNQADLVFEHYTEAGITRFSALYYGTLPRQVGSIRSARLIDYELAPMYGSLLAFSGGSIGVEKRIFGSAVVNEAICVRAEDQPACLERAAQVAPAGEIPPSDFSDRAYKGVLYGGPYFWRDEALPAPHNLFADPFSLQELALAAGTGAPTALEGFTFAEAPPAAPTSEANLLQVRYRTTVADWTYEPISGRYYRSSDGLVHFDAGTDTQVSAANVIVIFAGHYLTDIVESQSGDTIHWSQQITIWPEGDAILVRDGRRYDGRWLRAARGDALRLVTADGDPLPLRPGNTWIQLVPLPEQMDPDYEWVRVE